MALFSHSARGETMGAEGNLQLDLHMEMQRGAWQIRVIGILRVPKQIKTDFQLSKRFLLLREVILKTPTISN